MFQFRFEPRKDTSKSKSDTRDSSLSGRTASTENKRLNTAAGAVSLDTEGRQVDCVKNSRATSKSSVNGVNAAANASLTSTPAPNAHIGGLLTGKLGSSGKTLIRLAVKAVGQDNRDKAIDECMNEGAPLFEEAVPELHNRLKTMDEMWFLGFLHKEGLSRMTKLLIELANNISIGASMTSLLLSDCFHLIMTTR